jgi:hypothetical protein
LDQIEKIFQARGSPTSETWPNLPKPGDLPTDALPNFMYAGDFPGTPFKDIAVQMKRPCEDVGVALMDSMVGMFGVVVMCGCVVVGFVWFCVLYGLYAFVWALNIVFLSLRVDEVRPIK